MIVFLLCCSIVNSNLKIMLRKVCANVYFRRTICCKYRWINLSGYRSLSDLTHFDFKYFCDPLNTEKIRQNIKKRKGKGDIDEVIALYKKWLNSSSNEKELLKPKLLKSTLKIPNMSHSEISPLQEDPIVVKEIGKMKEVSFKLLPFEEIVNKRRLFKSDRISNFTGPRSYYLLDQLALLEQALISYFLFKLKSKNFIQMSIPDILPRHIIEMCGMETKGERTQVYSLNETKWNNLCLSGTAEMGIAYYLQTEKINKEALPMKIAAVSRCFRAETSDISQEKGLYRVHQFNKVEMFGLCSPSQSDSLLNEFVQIQEELFSSFGFSLRTLDMPPHELGAQASRKYDIEAWMPGRKKWGELSSASNCTDYQSRRLGLRIGNWYPHTINATACAIPRLIIALLETHQQCDTSVELPSVLEPYFGSRVISKSRIPALSAFKSNQRFG